MLVEAHGVLGEGDMGCDILGGVHRAGGEVAGGAMREGAGANRGGGRDVEGGAVGVSADGWQSHGGRSRS